MKKKYNKYEDIYPLTIIPDRYNGAYSGGKWLAFDQYHYNIPDEVDDGDVECCWFSDDIKGKEMKLRDSKCGRFREDMDEDQVEVTVLPGQTKFFGVRAVDPFEKVKYNCHIDYQFNLAKGDEIADEVEEEEDINEVEINEEE